MIPAESLGIQGGEMVSFIGAGGKTTMLFHLATLRAGSSSSSRSNRSSRPSDMGSLHNLNVLTDLNVWNIPERKACLRGENLFREDTLGHKISE